MKHWSIKSKFGSIKAMEPDGVTMFPDLWPCGFKIEYTYLGFALAAAV